MRPTFLIIDEMHSSITNMLEDKGFSVDYKPKIKPEEVLEIVHKYEGLIVRSKMKIGRELLERASKLVFIARAGAGLDQIDVDEVRKRNIQLFNAPEGNRDALAEHTVGMILALFNNICSGNNEVKSGVWNREGNRGFEVNKKTVALIGYGYMGRAVAQRLRSFNCRILVYDKDESKIKDSFVEKSSMEQIFEMADLVSFHIPLEEDTLGMVNYKFLSNFKNDIWVINTARGEILSTSDLIKLLNEGKVKGAALDVLENEKLTLLSEQQKEDFDKLCTFKNVVLTPHVGGWSFESYVRINEVLVEKIATSRLF